MRIRTIKPEFWTSEAIARLPLTTRLTFIGLWSYVDDNGVGIDNDKLVAAALFALEDDPRETLARVSRELQTLAEQRRIVRYTVDGRRYLAITSWAEHQKIDRPGKARYPGPDKADRSANQSVTPLSPVSSRDTRESVARVSRLEQGNRGTGEQGTEEQGTGKVAPAAPTAPDSPGVPGTATPASPVWSAYAAAYRRRYGTDPVRNAKANTLLKQLVARLGAEDAQHVAGFYVEHSADWYVRRGHALDVLLSDAEKLRTEWLTGRKVTSIAARQGERVQYHGDLAADLKREFGNG